MKKFYFLFLTVLCASNLSAQKFDKLWTKFCNATDFAWFNTSTQNNNTTGLAYNPVTNKVLVAQRNDNIYILNAETGTQEGTVTLGGALGSEAFKFNKIRVTSDGVIYGITLATGAGTCNIYRWANQTTAPTLCASFTVTERCGDAFGLSGSGNSTILYASGAQLANNTSGSGTKIYVLTTADGVSFVNSASISVPSASSQWTNRSVDPIGNTPSAGVWIDMSGGPARRLDITGASPSYTASAAYATTTGYNNGQVADSYCGMRYLQTSTGKKYLAFAGANNAGDGVTMKLLDVTDELNVSTYGTDTLMSGGTYWTYQTNGNGTGDIAFKDNGTGNYTIYYLTTNNAISAVRPVNALPTQLNNFSAFLERNVIKLNWNTTNEINCQNYQIERSIDGVNFAAIVVANALGNATNNYNYVDENALKIKTSKIYYRLKQVDKDSKFSYSKVVAVNTNSNYLFDASLLENPVRNSVQLVINAKKDALIEVSVLNMQGQTVYLKNASLINGSNKVNIPVENLTKGSYIIKLNDKAEFVETITFIKQ